MWYSYGNGTLVEVAPNVWRTASPTGVPGVGPWYQRHASVRRYLPPYTWSGRIRVLDRMDAPVWIPSEQRWSTWDHGVVWHVAHVSNDLNWNVTWSPSRQTTGVFTEVDGAGTWTWGKPGFVFRGPPMPLGDGQWHEWRAEVPEHGRFRFFCDGQLVAEGLEAAPSMSGAVEVGLRLDFYDVEIESDVDGREAGVVEGPIRVVDPLRILDSRSGAMLHPGRIVDVRVPVPAAAAMVTVTMIDAETPGYVTVWPSGARPDTSVQNHSGGRQAIAGTTLVRVADGRFRVWVSSRCHVAVDIVGVIPPGSVQPAAPIAVPTVPPLTRREFVGGVIAAGGLL